MDRRTRENLASLHPVVSSYAYDFINLLRSMGYPAVIISGRRSGAKQAELVRSGISPAKNSRHLNGTAFDIWFSGYRRDEIPKEVWDFVGTIGEEFGFRWGGRFTIPDVNHFDTG